MAQLIAETLQQGDLLAMIVKEGLALRRFPPVGESASTWPGPRPAALPHLRRDGVHAWDSNAAVAVAIWSRRSNEPESHAAARRPSSSASSRRCS
jgi:hypothetical protein